MRSNQWQVSLGNDSNAELVALAGWTPEQVDPSTVNVAFLNPGGDTTVRVTAPASVDTDALSAPHPEVHTTSPGRHRRERYGPRGAETTDDPDFSAHRTRSNVRRPTPRPDTVAEIEQVMEDPTQDRD